MLNSNLYEPLPHVCMLAAAAALILQPTPLSLPAGLLLFFAGARIYILRSDNRRTDPARKRRKGRLPKFLYEFMPFLCLAFGVLLLGFGNKSWYLLPSVGLMAWGLFVLASRANYRHHQIPLPRGNR